MTFRTGLIRPSVHLHKVIVIVYTRGVLQPSGNRRFGIGVSLLSPLRMDNGEPIIGLFKLGKCPYV